MNTSSTTAYDLWFTEDPAAFLAVAEDHLALDPVLTTVVSSVTHRAARRSERGAPRPKHPQWWAVVRDALTMGPYAGADSVTPHTRPPADEDGDHMLVRTVECIAGQVEIEVICEPAFDYGRTPAAWAMAADDIHAADATGAGQTFRLLSDLALGIEGNRVRGRHVLREGERAFVCITWAEGLAGPRSVEEAEERMAAALAAGGRLLTDQYARSFWVLADPEGNEVCICTWLDRA